MKCNKCLTIIPAGEEIRMNWSNSSTSNFANCPHCQQVVASSSYSHEAYGACYCETCWKTKPEYHYYEQGGREEEQKTNGRIFIITFVVIILLVIVAIWWAKRNSEKD